MQPRSLPPRVGKCLTVCFSARRLGPGSCSSWRYLLRHCEELVGEVEGFPGHKVVDVQLRDAGPGRRSWSLGWAELGDGAPPKLGSPGLGTKLGLRVDAALKPAWCLRVSPPTGARPSQNPAHGASDSRSLRLPEVRPRTPQRHRNMMESFQTTATRFPPATRPFNQLKASCYSALLSGDA